MKITFLGATKTVTGSNFLVEAAGKKFLVDCGMYQGSAEQEYENEAPFAFNPADIDFMLLTHAHIDHSGRIPKLYNEGFRNPIYAHKATCDLCGLMLPDSGHIQEMEIGWRNKKRERKGEKPIPPIYTADDAIRSLEIFKPVQYDEIIEITPDIHVRFNDAGHMLGSSIIEIWAKEEGKETKAVFTGDLGNNDLPLLDEPTMIDSTDFLIMESTYGSRLHMRNDDKAELFLQIVSETIENGGNVIIPSFAVGRTQEILYELNKIKETRNDEDFIKEYETLMRTSVYVDSPLAISATEVFKKNMELFDDEAKKALSQGDNPLEFPGLQFAMTSDESKALNENSTPSIIISASGMCEVGRIKHHLKHNLWNPKNTILFVGYQAPGTLGYNIVNGAKKVKIFGEEIAVNARIEYIEGYSGHADQEGLMNFIYSFRTQKPKHVFLIHGEEDSQNVLSEKIKNEIGLPVTIPNYGEEYELDDVPTMIRKVANRPTSTRREIMNLLNKLQGEMNDMREAVNEDLDNKELKDEDMFRIKEKIKGLENQILRIIEG